MVRILNICLIFMLFAVNLMAQKENQLIRNGNKLYEEGKFKEAEIDYRKALEKKPESVKGSFNLGNSLYRQENYEEAAKNFAGAERLIKDSDVKGKSAALHNLGNTLLKDKKIKESIEAYKQALRINPTDDETRYNLAWAMNQLQQQQQQQQQNKDNKDDKNDDKKEQNQQENKPNDQEQQKEQNREKPQISKQDAERMLEALKNDEQKTLDKVNQQKVKASGVTIEKDW
ncbi:MAG: tetratricopeptide repeat protein [Lentimicrobium sp.]|nr:tetratricopeptide repeat protein [Lentimicrobium sp.]